MKETYDLKVHSIEHLEGRVALVVGAKGLVNRTVPLMNFDTGEVGPRETSLLMEARFTVVDNPENCALYTVGRIVTVTLEPKP